MTKFCPNTRTSILYLILRQVQGSKLKKRLTRGYAITLSIRAEKLKSVLSFLSIFLKE